MSDILIRSSFAILFYAILLFGGYHRYRAHQQKDTFDRFRNEGPVTFLILRIVGGILWICCFLFPIVPELFNAVRLGPSLWRELIGLLLALTALPMGYSVFRHLGRNITDTVETRADHQLVTTGIYAYIRHPLYTTGFLLFFGLGLLSGVWPVLILSVLVLFVLALRTFEEERQLITRFGDRYVHYAERTGRFLPRIF